MRQVLCVGYWRDAAALLLVLLLCACADGLMDKLGPAWFPVVGGAVLAAAWALTKDGR